MNRFVSVALAGAMAVSMLGVSAGAASAGGWKHPHHGGPHHYSRPYNPGPAIAAGAFLGLTIGALAAQPYYYDPYPPAPPPPPVAYYPAYPSEHFNWCAATYDTYNSTTDTWTDFRGVVRPCIGP